MGVKCWNLALLSLLLLAMAACRQETPEPPSPPVHVKANPAYTANYGTAPVSAQGTCFARVGYYPLRQSPDQLQALPFFLFNEPTELPLLLQRLVGYPEAYLAREPVTNPFPLGSTLQVGPRAATLELKLQLPGTTPPAAQLAAMAAALTETAGQYPDIRQVRLLLNGQPWPGMPTAGFRPEPSRLVAPGPPQLLLVTGSWEPGAPGPAEILADFDRPVTLGSFRLTDEHGQKVAGDYFTGAFDMAVVIHPQHPEAFHEGMQLRATWQVTDKLGRSGSGEGRFALQRPAAGAAQGAAAD